MAIFIGYSFDIVVPAHLVEDDPQGLVSIEALKQGFGFDEAGAQQILSWRDSQGYGTGLTLRGPTYNQENVEPGSVRLTISTHEADFYTSVREQQQAQQQAFEIAVQQQQLANIEFQTDSVQVLSDIKSTPEQSSDLAQLETTLRENGQWQFVSEQAQQLFEATTRYTDVTDSEAQTLSEAAEVQVLLQNYQQAQEILLLGRTLTPEIRDGFERLFNGEDPNKQIPEAARQNISQAADRLSEESTGRSIGRNETLWQVYRNQQILSNFADIAIVNDQLVTASQPSLSSPSVPAVAQASDPLAEALAREPFVINGNPSTTASTVEVGTTNSTIAQEDRFGIPTSPEPPVVEQFKQTLRTNALNRLDQNQQQWDQELGKYQDLTDSSHWQPLRQVIEQDRQLSSVQQQLEQRVSTLDKDQLFRDDVFGNGPSTHGQQIVRQQQELKALQSRLADIKVARTALRISQAQFPVLSVLNTEQISPDMTNAEVWQKIQAGYQPIQDGIDQFDAKLRTDPNLPLTKLSDELLSSTRAQMGISDSDRNHVINQWIRTQEQKEQLIEIGGAAGSVTLGVAAMFASGGWATFVLSAASAGTGLGTSAYEIQQAEHLIDAAQAGVGGQPLTDASLKEAQSDNAWGWTGVVLGLGELALAGKALKTGLKGTEFAQQLAKVDGAGVFSQLNPKQAGQVLEALQVKLSGTDPQLAAAYKSLEDLEPSVLQEVKDFLNRVTGEGALVQTPDGLQIRTRPNHLDSNQPLQMKDPTKGDVLEVRKPSGDVTTKLKPRNPPPLATVAGDSGKLGNNLEAYARELARQGKVVPEGFVKPKDGYDAHHLVEGNRGANVNDFSAAKAARQLLEEFQIPLNGSDNGVWLPKNAQISLKEAPHSFLHTREYRQNVLQDLQRALKRPGKNGSATFQEQRQHLIDALGEIREELLNNTYPYQKLGHDLGQDDINVAQSDLGLQRSLFSKAETEQMQRSEQRVSASLSAIHRSIQYIDQDNQNFADFPRLEQASLFQREWSINDIHTAAVEADPQLRYAVQTVALSEKFLEQNGTEGFGVTSAVTSELSMSVIDTLESTTLFDEHSLPIVALNRRTLTLSREPNLNEMQAVSEQYSQMQMATQPSQVAQASVEQIVQ